MRLGTALKGLVIGALVVATGTAIAQPAAPAADSRVPLERQAKLSTQEQLAESENIIARIDATASGIRRQLENARTSRDPVKILCLNDKLSQVDVAGRTAKERKQALETAAKRNDRELSDHEFTILTVLKQRADQLSAESNQCIGEEAAFIGQTQVKTDIDPTLPPTDETQYSPTDPTLVSAPPQCASCSL